MLIMLGAVSCRKPAANPQSAPVVAVTTSYLECAVRDLLGDSIPVFRLAEPGMCPGHFDIRPSHVRQLRQCRLLLRFGFQDSMESQLVGAGDLAVSPINPGGGMCVVDSYRQSCQQVAAALVGRGLLAQDAAERRLTEIDARLDDLASESRARIRQAGLSGRPVVASGHQAAFCRWLGLEVVAALGGSDSASVKQVDRAVAAGRAAGCGIIIANRPEGTQLAELVAGALDARLVVFDNFPDLSSRQRTFDALVLGNVDRLISSVHP